MSCIGLVAVSSMSAGSSARAAVAKAAATCSAPSTRGHFAVSLIALRIPAGGLLQSLPAALSGPTTLPGP